MGREKTILPDRSLTGYQLASNEPMGIGSINRVIEHLLKNDDLLRAKLDELGYSYSLQLWQESAVYVPGDLVVYVKKMDNEEPLAFILLCIAEGSKEPSYTIVNGNIDFSATGWKLIHENTIYLHDDDFLRDNILTPATKTVIEDHQGSEAWHHGTIINSLSDFAKVFLRKDLSNYLSPVNERSDKVKLGSFGPNAIVRCGQIENSNLRVTSDRIIECDIEFSFDETANQDTEILNPRYYYEDNPIRDKSDSHIFNSYYMEQTQTLPMKNGYTYKNIRVPGTNVFSKVIEFPFTFSDTSYGVFQCAYLPTQFVFAATAGELLTKTQGGSDCFVSNILFVNKTPNSITAILPIHSHFGEYGKYVVGVPWINTFKVHLVGVRA